MLKTTENIIDLIGETPLLRINIPVKKKAATIYAKLETTNPTGSIKDRMVSYMIKKAQDRGELKMGMKIIEVTSGNTGVAFAMISAILGYKFLAVMPETVGPEKRKMMEFFGAKIILTPAKEDMAGAIKKYKELIKKNKNVWLPKQFENPDNIAAHREGLGKEIIKQTKGKIDAFVAGVGTGGTLIGVAQALKKHNSRIKIMAVEPQESAVLSGRKPGFHKIEGIGEGFLPKLVEENREWIDEVITIKSRDAINMSKRLAREYGILVGISAGANVLAAIKVSKRFKNIVTVLPDRGERYLNKKFFNTLN